MHSTAHVGCEPKGHDHHLTVNAKLMLAMLVFLFNLVVVFTINPLSIISYIYFFLLTFIIYGLLAGKLTLELVPLYALYSSIAIALYLLQYLTYPDYFGFSGGLGIGTDDAKFYSQVAVSLPPGFPVRGPFPRIHNYSRLLRFVSLYPVTHPFDVLFFNVVGVVFIPMFTREVAFQLTEQEKISTTAYRLVMLCPFLLADSLILLRDGWVTMASIGAVLFFLRKKYVKMVPLMGLLFYLRIGSALLIAFILAFFVFLRFIRKRGMSRKLLYAIVLLSIVGIVSVTLYPTVCSYLQGKRILDETLFFRERGISYAMSRSVQATSNEGSLTYKIYQQSALLRIPLGFISFFAMPWFVPSQIVKLGIVRPRAIMTNIFAILFIFYLKYFVQAFLRACKDRDLNLKVTILAYIAAILVLSQLSIQSRHKIMLLPLFYTVVAYGYHQPTKKGIVLGTLGALVLAVGEVVRALIRVV